MASNIRIMKDPVKRADDMLYRIAKYPVKCDGDLFCRIMMKADVYE